MPAPRSPKRNPDSDAVHLAQEAVERHLVSALERAAKKHHPSDADAALVGLLELASTDLKERAGERYRALASDGAMYSSDTLIGRLIGVSRQAVGRRYALKPSITA